MKIFVKHEVLELEFESQDWNYPHAKFPGGARQLIADLKTMLGQEAFYVDEETGRLVVIRTRESERVVENLKKVYLEDENQIPLFPEQP